MATIAGHVGDMTATGPVSFLDLPREVRDMVYGCLLDISKVPLKLCQARAFSTIGGEAAANIVEGLPPCSRPDLDLAILRMNKQVYQEARHVFYSANLFARLDIHSAPQTACLLMNQLKLLKKPSILQFPTRPSQNIDSAPVALELTLVVTPRDELSLEPGGRSVIHPLPPPCLRVLVPNSAVPGLIIVWRALATCSTHATITPDWWASTHKLHLRLANTYSYHINRMKALVLEPWRSIYRLHTFVMHPNLVGKEYAQGLEQHVRLPLRPRIWIDDLRYNKQIISNQYKIVRSKEPFEITKLDKFCKVYLHILCKINGEIARYGEQFGSAIKQILCDVERLLYQCSMNMVLVLLDIHQVTGDALFEDAVWWADRAVDLCTGNFIHAGLPVDRSHRPKNDHGWSSKAEKAKAFYRRGCARGESDEVAVDELKADFERALAYQPGNTTIQKAYAKYLQRHGGA
ncbi:MAG: hypothetical protein M1821_007356 [Bathelium mastoideum]|nr:MAG: hypothetical protein M1821_007356 [Bathelium mastoideum]KAI9694859.1 MAG: hypothetical protein M1822_000475 [Bathelium mastoideum]